jgi:cytochrome c-type biogenesis protein CcmH/NrfG
MRLLENHPQVTEGWVELAKYWQVAGNSERQRKAVERALHLDPLNVEALRLQRDLQD